MFYDFSISLESIKKGTKIITVKYFWGCEYRWILRDGDKTIKIIINDLEQYHGKRNTVEVENYLLNLQPDDIEKLATIQGLENFFKISANGTSNKKLLSGEVSLITDTETRILTKRGEKREFKVIDSQGNREFCTDGSWQFTLPNGINIVGPEGTELDGAMITSINEEIKNMKKELMNSLLKN